MYELRKFGNSWSQVLCKFSVGRDYLCIFIMYYQIPMLRSNGEFEDCYLVRSGWSVVEKQIDILTSYEIYNRNRSRIIILHVEATTTYS